MSLTKKEIMIPVCIRMPEDLLDRLKELAPQLGFRGYQPRP